MSTPPRPLATFCCTVIVCLDGKDVIDDDAPDCEANYQEAYRTFWREMGAWMRAEGIEPIEWPTGAGFWYVAAAGTFEYRDVAKVAAYLTERGATVFNYAGLASKIVAAGGSK